ncbi:MAG: TVP38/TMEM64 family protein, partial [Gammaproteobacteria bacterium]
MTKSRILLVGIIAVLIYLFFAFHLTDYLTLEYFKSQQTAFVGAFHAHPLRIMGLYAAFYVAVTALSLPGAALMTLVGGAVFGLLWGTVVVSFASTIGATLAFLVSRFLLRDTVQRKFGSIL